MSYDSSRHHSQKSDGISSELISTDFDSAQEISNPMTTTAVEGAAAAYVWGYPTLSPSLMTNGHHSEGLIAFHGWNPASSTIFETDTTTNASNSTSGDLSESQLAAYDMPRLLTTLIILGLIILSAIIGNVFVIAAVILERNLHNVANYLVASLASADLMVATLVMPLAVVNEVSTRWFLGSSVCNMWVTFDVICCTASILHLVAISVDRYWAVTRVAYIHNRSAKKILFMVALSWMLALAISVPPLLFKSPDFDPNTSGECIINQNLFYQTFSTICAFYVPFVAVMIIYLKVFLEARKRIRKKRFKQSKRQMLGSEAVNIRCDETTAFDGPSNISNPTPTDASAMAGNAETYMYSPLSTGPDNLTMGSLVNNQALGSKETLKDETNCNGTGAHKVEPESRSSGSQGSAVSPVRSHLGLHPDSGGQLCVPVVRGQGTGQVDGGIHPQSSKGNPPSSLNLKGSFMDLTKQYREKRPTSRVSSPKTKERRAKEKLEQKRERKAARTLAIITGSFCICWLPFFIVAITRPFCGTHCHFPVLLLSIINWLGYFNSLLNPIIYTVFNPDFRLAFRKILFGKYRRQNYQRTRS